MIKKKIIISAISIGTALTLVACGGETDTDPSMEEPDPGIESEPGLEEPLPEPDLEEDLEDSDLELEPDNTDEEGEPGLDE